MRSQDSIETIVLAAERLRGLSFSSEWIQPLLNWADLITLRRNLGKHRPLLIGLIGCSGTGKSTLFNSLAGKDLCRTGWAAHNTQGPVLLAHNDFFIRLQEIENQFGTLLFPAFKREISSITPNIVPSSQPTELPPTASRPNSNTGLTGAPNAVCFISSATIFPRYGNTSTSMALIDLPDINTTLAREERSVTLELQPWLDAVIFVVDEETVYHRDYEQPARRAVELEQSRFCVLNHRGKDRVVLDHPDMQKVRDLFGVDEIHLLTEFKAGSRFVSEPAFLHFQERLHRTIQPAAESPLRRELAKYAQVILEENRKKLNHLDTLLESVDETIHERLSHELPIPLEHLLPNEVLQVLHHLGLRRFSLSNLGHFLKRTVTTGALKHSFQAAFGNRRDFVVAQVFQFDPHRLREEVHKRIADHKEALAETIFHDTNIDSILAMAPDLKTKLLFPQNRSSASNDASPKIDLDRLLNSLVADFEKQCRDLTASDTLANAVKNDPLVAFSLVLVLVTDVFLMPGFGSWLLVPTVFQYLPFGKFEQLKRKFQQSIQDVIRQNLGWIPRYIREVKNQSVLEESDTLIAALQVCAEYHDTND